MEGKKLARESAKKFCEDAISRGAAIAAIYDKYMSSDMTLANPVAGKCIKIIQELPSVRPARPRGKWKKISIDKYVQHATYYNKCSECGKDIVGEHNYCPNCGADMRESEEE